MKMTLHFPKYLVTVLAAPVALFSPLLHGQTLQAPGLIYQQAQVISGSFGSPANAFFVSGSSMGGQVVVGKPAFGTEERHSVQVLGDGTRIEHTDSSAWYRDDKGRTRVETGPPGSSMITIQDPVAGTLVTLDTATRTARKMQSVVPPPPPPGGQPAGIAAAGNGVMVQGVFTNSTPPMPGSPMAAVTLPALATPGNMSISSAPHAFAVRRVENNGQPPVTTDLGSQIINGVTAQGTRNTLTIPLGQIGNDRPIQVVDEHWYSSDLQMPVRTSNSDPRFGDATWQLTNIVRSAPDPSLFQIPSDYTIADDKPQFQQMRMIPKPQ
jgi:hypothetical protein